VVPVKELATGRRGVGGAGAADALEALRCRTMPGWIFVWAGAAVRQGVAPDAVGGVAVRGCVEEGVGCAAIAVEPAGGWGSDDVQVSARGCWKRERSGRAR